ncbi:MAG: 4Fe-4S binding protein [Nitrospirae bacterium]|nr:4Fe-4S binding protein [Nitrospirota bacterium]
MNASTDKDSEELRVMSYESKEKEDEKMRRWEDEKKTNPNFSTSQVPDFKSSSEFKTQDSKLKVFLKPSRLRRIVLFSITVLFLLQFLRIKILVGGPTASLAFWSINLINVFAFLESFAASKSITMQALTGVLPVVGIYLIFGRAFCGWCCPLDFLFEMVGKLRVKSSELRVRDKKKIKIPALQTRNFRRRNQFIGYGIVAVLLAVSAILGVPFFTRYLSHLTNFFMVFNSSIFLALDLPVSKTVLIYSGAAILSLLLLEYVVPRTWCKILCPVGITYGLFNKVSLLKLRFKEGKCGECNLCEEVCYMDVKITHSLDQPGLRDTNCIYCGRCAEGCGTKGKLVSMSLKLRVRS